MNFTISSKKYHYLTKQGLRDDKAERWTRQFKQFEENDRNDRTKYPRMPSPKGNDWRDYIRHRLTIMKKAIEVYTTEKYTRLRFDKYIESNRVSDKIAAMLVRMNSFANQNTSNIHLVSWIGFDVFFLFFMYSQTNRKASIVHIGASQVSPDSPIRIKKHMRCPGTRKLAKSFKKMSNVVVRWVNEKRTSRICARCLTPFPLCTLSDRYKVCEWCMPDQTDWPATLQLPPKIVAKKSKRKWRTERREQRIAAEQNPIQGAGGLVSKVICYRKNWQQNAANDADDNAGERRGVIIHNEYVTELTEEYEPEPEYNIPCLKTIWHRDISAAKLILYKGEFELNCEICP